MKSKIFNFFKIFILFVLGITLLVASGVGLRKLCATMKVKAYTEPAQYLLINEPLPLFKNNNLTEEIITLPQNFYAKVISSNGNLSRVEYNGILGYVDNSTATLCSTPPQTAYQTATIFTRSDAGTHLRTRPDATSNKVALIPPGTEIEYVGEILGEQPSDGTSKLWYYVHYNLGATTTYTGYVYSERTIITSREERPASPALPDADDTLSTTVTPNEENLSDASLPTNISSGLKIFLVILFSTLGVIIFALLLISPKAARKKDTAPHDFDLTPPREEKISNKNIPAYNQPEFGNFVEFTQPASSSHQKSNKRNTPSPHQSEKVKLFSPKAKTNKSHLLPPAIARYFVAERRENTPTDDEELL